MIPEPIFRVWVRLKHLFGPRTELHCDTIIGPQGQQVCVLRRIEHLHNATIDCGFSNATPFDKYWEKLDREKLAVQEEKK